MVREAFAADLGGRLFLAAGALLARISSCEDEDEDADEDEEAEDDGDDGMDRVTHTLTLALLLTNVEVSETKRRIKA